VPPAVEVVSETLAAGVPGRVDNLTTVAPNCLPDPSAALYITIGLLRIISPAVKVVKGKVKPL
jgi:hypothetical protein